MLYKTLVYLLSMNDNQFSYNGYLDKYYSIDCGRTQVEALTSCDQTVAQVLLSERLG